MRKYNEVKLYDAGQLSAGYKTVVNDLMVDAWSGLQADISERWKLLSERVEMKQLLESSEGFGAMPTPQLYNDEVQFSTGFHYTQSMRLRQWAAGVRIDRELFRVEKFGEAEKLIRDFMLTMVRFRERLMAFYIEAGDGSLPTDTYGLTNTITTTFDGANFFSATHQYGNSPTQSNLRTSSALTITNLAAALTQMRQLRDDQGNYMGLQGSHIIIPHSLAMTAKQLLGAQNIIVLDQNAATTTFAGNMNVVAGEVQAIVMPYLESATSWYLADLNTGKMPFLYTVRAGEPEQLSANFDQPTDWVPFVKDQNFYGIRSYFNFQYKWWPVIQKNEA